ncbi:major royal jelly protein [Gramella sp. Hel_I_59]|uniref:L-dopachrome tautomerase-related protein n=1 Tax=Gramella sp. Hel_I_59 TaxID=1249978 RepID=UPI00115261AE|nr:L-dopachrome tautomerase-related protein [Gramella sp. Hel_I_59]TQI70513.1 major royal jelly protein [Gramella sp. Hel_I_59]
MKKLLLLLLIVLSQKVTSQEPIVSQSEVEKVTAFKGQQVTGISLSQAGRIFANFPRWRKNVEHSVVEMGNNKKAAPYPNAKWNSWKVGEKDQDSIFVAVQSVIASENELFVLDTRNPLFQGVVNNPRIFVFDLESDKLKHIYELGKDSFYRDSYINDLRVDRTNDHIYLTDSNHAGLVVIDMATGASKRVLSDHYSTLAETDELTINGEQYKNTIHSDGIALDEAEGLLYYHALTGYTLYSVPTKTLREGSKEDIQKSVKEVAKTTAPDGMILNSDGMLYLADLENNAIMRYNTKLGEQEVLAQGEKIRWADTFSLYDGYLYYTNSRINEVRGDISDMKFSIYRIKL